MKLLLLACCLSFASARVLLGNKRCTWGPAYWCSSLKNAHECGTGAIVHCAKKVWPQSSQGEMCTLCTEAVSVVHSLLSDNATEAEIVAGLKEICSLMGSMASECNSLIDSYGTEIIEIIAQYTADPSTLCKMMGLCQSTKQVPFLKLKPAQMMSIARPMPMMPGPVMVDPKTTSVGDSTYCVICEYAMEYLEKMISKSSTQEEIEDALDKVCKLMPSTVSLKCQEFVNTFTPAILNILTQYANPKVVCSMLKLCTSTNEATSVRAIPKEVKSGVVCEFCTVAVGYIDNMLKNKKTEDEIIAEVTKVCKYIPNQEIANECTQLVTEYGKQIIALLANELSPEAVCQELGLCSASKKTEKEKIRAGVTCTICEAAVGYLDSLLKNNATEAEITAALKQACSYLPGEFRSTCTQLVDEYVPYIIKLLEEQSPQEICTLLKMCQAQKSTSAMRTTFKEAPLRKARAGELCEVCEMAVGYIDNLLKSQATVAEIKQMMDSFCSYLPSSLATECQAFVNEYVDQVIKLLTSIPADQVCKELGLCTSARKLVGGEKCTWGPSYWCSSKAAAKACKAFEHCEAKKWLI